MKKILFASMAAGTLIFASCSGSKADEQAREDSERRADSIEAVEDAARSAERARQDSIRLDSIQKAEEFASAIPSFTEVADSQGNWASLFKKRGFSISYKSSKGWDNEMGEDVTVKLVIAKLNEGSEPSCVFTENNFGFAMTINGAPELLDQYDREAKAYVAKLKKEQPDDWYTQGYKVTRSGNTVTMSWPEGE